MTDYDVVETPAGPCIVGMRRGKVTLLRLGTDRSDLTGCPRRLPAARRALAAWFRGKAPRLPLDVSWAGEFERRVYDIVRRIPPGRTLTYGQVAEAAGRPGAARAVGNAMARNRICLFIPCHRVVGAAGLGGYSGAGGLTLKRSLLDREARPARETGIPHSPAPK